MISAINLITIRLFAVIASEILARWQQIGQKLAQFMKMLLIGYRKKEKVWLQLKYNGSKWNNEQGNSHRPVKQLV